MSDEYCYECGETHSDPMCDMTGANSTIEELEKEIAYLSFFFGRAGDFFGPAESDIYETIAEEYKAEGNDIPEGYE